MRLAVDGDRIVEADAPGLARPLAGLTLLEAAAVPGETLAADALANALAQVFRADPDPDRIAVAMSGGVDSAVALLRAGPKAIGVTLRLWLDPAGPDSERACCSPEAVIAARETCHALGLPHVTLDLREEFRRAVVDPFVAALRPRRDAEPVRPLQRRASASPSCSTSPTAPARPRSGPATTRASSSATAGGCSPAPPTRTRTSRTCSRRSTRRCSTGSSSRSASRRRRRRASEAGAAGLDVAERRESQEACFLAGDDYRAFLERRGLEPAEGAIVDEDGVELGRHDGVWRYTPGQRRGIGVAAAEPLYALRSDAATNTLVVGPRGSLACTTVEVRGMLLRAGRATSRRSCATARRRCPRASTPTATGFTLELDAAGLRRRSRPDRRALRRRRRRRLRRGVGRGARSRMHGVQLLAASAGDIASYALAVFLLAVGLGARVHVRAPGRNLRAAFFVHQGNGSANCCP